MNTDITQSDPILRWTPTIGRGKCSSMIDWACWDTLSDHTRYLWRREFSAVTGKEAGAPAKTSTGQSSGGNLKNEAGQIPTGWIGWQEWLTGD